MEKFMFIAFRSREHTVKFFEEMRSRGIVGTVINTPREAEAGCGQIFPTTKKCRSFDS